jgi:hypothetical protein
MDAVSYIVHLIDGPYPARPVKHFEARNNARSFAKQIVSNQQAVRADIYEVPARETGAAIAALRMGQGSLVESHGRPPTESERERAGSLKSIRWEDLFPELPDKT